MRRFGEEVVIANNIAIPAAISHAMTGCKNRTFEFEPGSAPDSKVMGNRGKRETTMRKLGILGLAALALALMTLDATAQMGGAVRGGVRGAAVGQMIGGDSAAKAGAVVGATRGAMDKETQMRAQYQTTPAYMNATHSNFNQVPPDVLVTPKAGATASKGGEAVINKGGKPAVGITFPPDWKQQSGETYVSAVSADGNAYSMLAIMESVTNLQAGIDQIKEGLKRYLNDIKYDDQTKTKGGALVITGTGKGTK